MSTAGATALALILYAVPVVTVVLVGWFPGLPRTIGAILGVATLGFVFGQTGILSQGGLAETDVSDLAPPDATALARCNELFDTLRQARVLTDGDGAISIQGAIWDRLPPEAHEALTQCATNAQVPLELNIVR